MWAIDISLGPWCLNMHDHTNIWRTSVLLLISLQVLADDVHMQTSHYTMQDLTKHCDSHDGQTESLIGSLAFHAISAALDLTLDDWMMSCSTSNS